MCSDSGCHVDSLDFLIIDTINLSVFVLVYAGYWLPIPPKNNCVAALTIVYLIPSKNGCPVSTAVSGMGSSLFLQQAVQHTFHELLR